MSHVVSVTPAGPLNVNPGSTTDFVVNVNGVPADDVHTVTFIGSDNIPIAVQVTRDLPSLQGITSGTPLANEVKGSITSGGGTLTVLSVSGSNVTFRYVAP